MLYNIKYVMVYNICNRLNFDRICIFHKHLRSSCGAERKFVKKIYRSEFLQSSFIFVIYLLKEVYRKIMSEIHFVDKTRYEDLTETGFKIEKNIHAQTVKMQRIFSQRGLVVNKQV